MYYRSQGYPYQRNMSLPPNYGGNAFSEGSPSDENSEIADSAQSEDFKPSEQPTKAEEIQMSGSKEAVSAGSLRLGSLLNGKIGAEELLLLAVIFLLSDSQGSDDVLWLLILLLFIK